ncbi:MAG: flagellar basal body rod protein FlgC [Myxococcales bacterium]|jgi:flagellar basal-body rod protein FlgC|nr:flagellar basal body rod protein FlgC [Myxococcales bacterium]
MDFFTAMRIASSGLSVQRTRINVTSSNLANVETTRTEEGGPYRRRSAVVAAVPLSETFEEVLGDTLHDKTAGAEVVTIASDEAEGRLVYDPEHPDANAEGYVEMPNVNVINEMVDMLTASRSYEANVTAIQAIKGMAQSALEIGS